MAIDTASKRASALGVGLAFTLLVIPDGTIAQADRQTIANSYSGILAAEPVIDTPDCFAAFIGHIDTKIGFIGAIDDQTNAFIGPIDAAPTASIGVIFTKIGFIGTIDDAPSGFIGKLDDKIGFDGEICDC